ncbi:MAG: hypothetical protein JHD02_01315 [Thermoleophilaceae bacterium]|nr:hypothetical protein [Thermoleophilaceae bacterium]
MAFASNYRRGLELLLILLALVLFASTAEAASKTVTYKGKATAINSDFSYGAAKAKVRSSKLSYLKLDSVSASCGYSTILRVQVYDAASKVMKITKGSNKVKNGKVKMSFMPDPDLDATIELDLKVSSSKVTGTVKESGVCTASAKVNLRR